ncbi:site-specific recombinase XerD [Bacilli bacterium PM5-3]|nr:site-specific recombinase XerD [Bacilli bacterium PM5-3]
MLKKKSTKVLLAILTILIVILGVFEVKSYLDSKNSRKVEKVTTKQIGPYIVNANQSEYQKEVEQALITALAGGQGKDIVPEVSKYFISDYFTLKDKSNYNNVGGMGFVLPDVQAKFKTNAVSSYYRDLATFKETYGKDNLPQVKSVEVDKPKKVSKKKVELDKDSKTVIKFVFDVNVTWEYEENEKLADMKVVNKAKLRFVSTEDSNWYVYEIVGVE